MSHVYSFKEGFKDKSQLGNKGGNLVTMAVMGLPVPPGFVVTIDAYQKWRETGMMPADEIREHLATLEEETGHKLGRGLEVSVRSSAPVSMPGMMDTVLNVRESHRMMNAVKRIFESWDTCAPSNTAA